MDCDENSVKHNLVKQKQPMKINEKFVELVIQNDSDEVRRFLEFSKDKNAEDYQEVTKDTLHMGLVTAAEKGFARIVELLLKEKRLEVNRKNVDGLNALDLASENGHARIVRTLLDHKSIKVRDEHYQHTSLHSAAENGHLDVVKALLVNADKGRFDWEYEVYTDADSPIAYGTDIWIDSKNLQEFTPLHLAAQNGHTDVVGYLLRMDADEGKLDDDDNTALHLAAMRGHAEAVRLLLHTVVEIRRGVFPHFYASDYDDYDSKGKAGVNWYNDEKKTPLHLAAQKGYHQVVEILLGHGHININSKPGSKTALHLATEGGHSEVIECLLRDRRTKNLKDGLGRTAIKIAQDRGDTLTLQILRRRFNR